MTKYNISPLEPGIKNINAGEDPQKNRYTGGVYVEPPFRAGPALGKFLCGNDFDYNGVSVAEVASTEKGTHLALTTAVGQAATAEAVEQVIGRLGEYLDADPMQLGVLGAKFAAAPIITRIA